MVCEETSVKKPLTRPPDGLKKGDMTANEIAPAELDRIKAKAQPVVEKFAKDIGEGLYQEVVAEIGKARKK
jgi:TRAP-type transport system periplasmic protein